MSYTNANNKDEPAKPTTGNPYTISEWDKLYFDMYTPVFAIYKYQEKDNPNTYSQQKIITTFQKGLKKATKQLPPISAKLNLNNLKRPMTNTSPTNPTFKVRTFLPGEYKSYDELAERSFLTDDFDISLLVPEEVLVNINNSENNDERCICFIQLNFIPGGIIFTIGGNHMATDITSIDMMALLICECTKACLENRSPNHHEYNFDRRLFIPPTNTAEEFDPDPANMPIIFDKTNIPPPIALNMKPPAAGSMKGQMYRITTFNAKKLKELCKPMTIDNGVTVEYISTYDCFIAMLFKSIARVRTTINPSLLQENKEWWIYTAYNLRPRKQIPQNYFGNGINVVPKVPISITDILGHDGCSFIASSSRRSILNNQGLLICQRAVAAAANANMHMHIDQLQKAAVLVPTGFPETSLLVSDWCSIDVANWDFGIGSPSALRSFSLPTPNTTFLFPDCSSKHETRAYLYVCLTELELDLLNIEFRRWFELL